METSSPKTRRPKRRLAPVNWSLRLQHKFVGAANFVDIGRILPLGG